MEEIRSKLSTKNLLSIIQILSLLFFIGGVFGFIYEEIFYRIDLGYWVKRGTSFGPWIPIYGFGSMLIFIFTYMYRKRPILVFSLTCIVTAILEFTTGYMLDKICNLRLWNYNEEIWNFGNIGGYVCLRSILFFGISGLLLMYVIYPIINLVSLKCNKFIYNLLCFVPSIVFAIDFAVNVIVF